MKASDLVSIAAVVASLSISLAAQQEQKPVPKGSVRVAIAGCTKGYVFTAGRRTEDEPGSVNIPEGMHIRMNGPKKLIGEIKAHEGSKVVITGTMKEGQFRPDGVGIGGGVRVGPSPSPGGGFGNPLAGQIMIDVEGWRPAVGDCQL